MVADNKIRFRAGLDEPIPADQVTASQRQHGPLATLTNDGNDTGIRAAIATVDVVQILQLARISGPLRQSLADKIA